MRPAPILALALPTATATLGGFALGGAALGMALFCLGLWVGFSFDSHTDRR